MKSNRKGLYCSTPIEKDAQGSVTKWCDYQPPTTTAKTAFVVPAPPPKVEALLEDMLEQLNAIRILLEMKRDNLDPSDIPL